MPKADVDISNYESALDHTFSSSEQIKNIALMGAYGSGKSSIINTYANKHPELKFLHISLAHFSDNTELLNNRIKGLKSTIPKENNKVNENKADKIDKTTIANFLEGKILNQLIHQIDPCNISDSNFAIKQPLSKFKKTLYTVSLFIFTISIIYATLYNKWKHLIESWEFDYLDFTLSKGFKIFLILLCVMIILFAINALVCKNGYFKRLRKIGIKNVLDIEIFDSTSDSAFDKYLNEVLYLFKNSGADVIVFEDLDRYDCTLIFEKLREINYLINVKNNDKIIRFYYLIKDDIFASSDRSKFFDFIIPIIPIVDITNASDKFSKLLEKANCLEGIDKHFLKDLSFYINDMRLLNNIVNEFQIYKNSIKLVDKYDNTNYQLAMIVYKNLFPEDFHALQAGHGFVYQVFKYKDTLCESTKKDLNYRKEKIYGDIKQIESEILRDIDELNALYFPLNHKVYTVDEEMVDENLGRTDLIRLVMSSKESVIIYKNGSYPKLDLAQAIKTMENNTEYQSRVETLKLLNSQKMKDQDASLIKISNEIKLISTKRLKTFLSQDDSELFWKAIEENYSKENEFTNSVICDRNYLLIKYLIINGYINEEYAAYSSYIYSDDLSPIDRNFIMSVYDGKQLSYEYALNNPEKIIENINPSSFMLIGINNYDLLKFVLHSDNKELIQTWFATIDNNEDIGYQFLVDFWRLNKANTKIVQYITNLHPEWLLNWFTKELLTEEEFIDFISEIISLCPYGTLKNINLDYWITKKISNDTEFLNIYPNDIQKYCSELKSIDVKFTSLKCQQRNKEILDYIYKNNMYQINKENVFDMVQNFTKFNIELDLSKFCTYILKNTNNQLSKYLLNNINNFIELVCSFSKKKFQDEQGVILSILNNKELFKENKITYIKKSSKKIHNIAKVEDINLWADLLNINAFTNSWRNLAIYYSKIEADDGAISKELADHMSLATGFSVLSFKNLNNLLTYDTANILRRNFIISTFFDRETYKRIITTMNFFYNSFSILNLLPWQFEILLQTNTIAKNKENYNFIKENYSKNTFDFVFIGDTKKVFKLIKDSSIVLERNEILELLSDSRATDEQSLILLDIYDGNITLENKKFSDEVCAKIISKHFNLDDLPWLLKQYSSFGDKTKNAIIEYSLQNVSRVINVANTIKNLPVEMFASFILHQLCDVTTLRQLRRVLSDYRFEELCSKGKSPTFNDTVCNKAILEFFKKQGWISSYSYINGKVRAYPKRKVS